MLGKWLCEARTIEISISRFHSSILESGHKSIRFRSSKESKKAENGNANQDRFDLQFSIGDRVRALAQARAGPPVRASRRSINPP